MQDKTNTTYNKILKLMEEKYTELTGCNIQNSVDISIRMKIFAEQIGLLYEDVEEIKKQAFIQTATGTSLDNHAVSRGIKRRDAKTSSGILVFARQSPATSDIKIPEGTICKTDQVSGISFKTTQDIILKEGEISVQVPAVSIDAGIVSNVGKNSIKFIVSPIPGISIVNNPEIFTGGADKETDNELRDRVSNLYKNLSNGTNSAFYYSIAMSHKEVYSCNIIPRQNGRGTVTVIVAGQLGGVSQETIDSLQEQYNSEKEISVDVQVISAKPNIINLDIKILLVDDELYQQASEKIQSKIKEFFVNQKVAQKFYLSKLIATLATISEIENIKIGSPQNDIQIYQDEIAVLGSISISRIGEKYD